MAIDLRLIKRKWKLVLAGWFVLLIVVNAFNIIYLSKKYPQIQDWVMGEQKIVKVEGKFSPRGEILFSMSPVMSINGWHKSECIMKPVFSKLQEKMGLNRILQNLKINLSDGTFGYDDIPLYKLRQKFSGVDDPIDLKMNFILPDNEKIVGETVLYEVSCTISYPRRIGEDKYYIKNETFTDKVPVVFHKSMSGGGSDSTIGGIYFFFFILWITGLIIIYKKIKKSPY